MDSLLIKAQPSTVTLKDGSPLIHLPDYQEKLEYRYGLELPHFLTFSPGEATAIVPTALVLEVGMTVQTEYEKAFLITEIVERRKARGVWKNNPYDERPDWVRMKII